METHYVLYYMLPNRRLAVVRSFTGIALSYANEENAISFAQYITANEVYYLDYPITVLNGYKWDNTVDGIDRLQDDTIKKEIYGYPIGKQPRGLYPIERFA